MKSDSENPVADGSTDKSRRPRRRSGVLRIILINLTVLLVPVAIYYALVVVRFEQSQHERSLRALYELSRQFDGRLKSAANLVWSMPRAAKEDSKQEKENPLLERYRKAIIGVDSRWLVTRRRALPIDGHACPPEPASVNLLSLSGQRSKVTVIDCKNPPGIASLDVPIASLLQLSASNPEFARVMVATARGEVIAELTPPASSLPISGGSGVPGTSVPIRVRTLLESMARGERAQTTLAEEVTARFSSESKVASDPTAPYFLIDGARYGDVVVGAQPFVAYVLPYRPSMPLYRSCDAKCVYPETLALGTNDCSKAGACLESEPAVYLIGLSRQDAASAARQAMTPAGLMALVALLFGVATLWPIARLRFLEPNDALGRASVYTLALGILTAAIALTATWRAEVLQQSLIDAARFRAEDLANTVAQDLKSAIDTQLAVIRGYETWPTNASSCAAFNGKVTDTLDTFTVAEPMPPDLTLIMRVNSEGQPRKTTGKRADATDILLNTACKAGPSQKLDVKEREYFKQLADPLCLTAKDASGTCGKPFAVARLRNLIDGIKLATFALPQKEGGALVADSRMLKFTNALMPYHFQYAIFENTRGDVQFHSDDLRSLVENFYAETEQSAQLLLAVDRHTPTAFAGTYRGTRSWLVTRPLDPMPWTLVIFFAEPPVSLLAFYAQMDTLLAMLPLTLLGFALGFALIRAGGASQDWLWPQWRLRAAYGTAALQAILVGAITALAVAWSGDLTMVLAVLFAPVALLLLFAATLEPLSLRLDAGRLLRIGNLRLLEMVLRRRHLLVAMHALAMLLVVTVAAEEQSDARRLVVLGALVLAHFLLLVRVIRRGPRRGMAFHEVRSAEGRLVARYRIARRHRNPWRRPLMLDPAFIVGHLSLGAWRLRHRLFLIALVLALGVMPVWALFGSASRWLLDAASVAAAHESARQLNARVAHMKDDIAKVRGRNETNLVEAAVDIGGFGFAHGALAEACPLGDEPRETFGLPQLRYDVPRDIAATPRAQGWPEWAWRHVVVGSAEWLLVGTADGEAGDKLWRREDPDGCRVSLHYRAGDASGTGYALTYARLSDDVLAKVSGEEWMQRIGFAGGGLVLFLLISAALGFVSRRLFGEPLSWSGQFGPRPLPVLNPTAPPPESSRLIMLVRPNAIAGIPEANQFDLASVPCETLAQRIRFGGSGCYLLSRLDVAITDPKRRDALLPILEGLPSHAHRKFFFSVDVPPLYRICQPDAYPDGGAPLSTEDEQRWIDLFAQIDKRYGPEDAADDPIATRPHGHLRGFDTSGLRFDPIRRRELEELIDQEARPLWPTLRTIAAQLEARLDADSKLVRTERDIVEYFTLHAETHFRRAWESCTQDERLALYQLARDRLVNADNTRVIEHLVRRGLAVIEPYARLTSRSLREFVLHAESPQTFERWQAEAAAGIWQSIRMPLMIILLLILTWVAYSSGDMLQIVVALVGSAVTFLGAIFRAVSVIRTGSSVADQAGK
jgi:hypothetical protein